MRWGMVIDLRKCIGCQTCTYVCEQISDTPSGTRWRKVVECEVGEYAKMRRIFLPMNCMHCSEPSCLKVCPTTATYRRTDGIVDICDKKCVGCGSCIVACPYQARTISPEDKLPLDEGAYLQETHDRIGICTKCNFCFQKIDAGMARGLRPGVDAEATPNCVNFCVGKALYFGDLDNPDSIVSQLIRNNRTARLQEEVGTNPSVYYIGINDTTTGTSVVKKTQLIQPMKQIVWGWPAVINFLLGGGAAGYYLLSLLMITLNNKHEVFQLSAIILLSPILLMLGFFALTIEAGRPTRGLYLFLHLRYSWMSRESLTGVIFFVAVILDWFFPHIFLCVLAATAAAWLMISQGFIVYRSRAVTAWNIPFLPLLFLTSGFVTGVGLMLLVAALWMVTLNYNFVIIGLICIALDMIVWFLYLRFCDADFQEVTEGFHHLPSLVFIAGIGHLLPILLLLLLLVNQRNDFSAVLQHVITLLAGLAIIIGGVKQKASIILRAGYLRGIVMGTQKDYVKI